MRGKLRSMPMAQGPIGFFLTIGSYALVLAPAGLPSLRYLGLPSSDASRRSRRRGMHLCMLFVFVERHQPTDKTEPILISLLPRSWEWTPSDLTPNSKGGGHMRAGSPLAARFTSRKPRSQG